MVEKYNTGADMWRDYSSRYGEIEARGICNRYLDMQVFTKDPEEQQFCRELFAAIPKGMIGANRNSTKKGIPEKPSLTDGLKTAKEQVSKKN